MIDLYFWATPNGYKPLIFLEEAELKYELKLVNIMKGEQFDPDFLKIAPNNRMPAIVDRVPSQGREQISVFESGAILLYLAEKTGQFLPDFLSGRYDAIQWLMWQMGGLGPMAGQANHFMTYAPEDVPYGKKRYVNETERLMGVLDKRLADRDFVAQTYSVADMAIYPWAKGVDSVGIDWQSKFSNVAAWAKRISERPAVQKAYEIGEKTSSKQPLDEEARKNLFGDK